MQDEATVREIMRLSARIKELEEALRGLLNICHGLNKSGGIATAQEGQDAMDNATCALGGRSGLRNFERECDCGFCEMKQHALAGEGDKDADA